MTQTSICFEWAVNEVARTKVLVVEDNASTGAMIKSTLELEGYEVVHVTDGLAALRSVASDNPNAVILDVMMPGIDGFEVLKRIRDNEATRELPVLMLTALDDNDSTWKGWSNGCHYYMTKPFELDDLIDAVHNLVSGVAA